MAKEDELDLNVDADEATPPKKGKGKLLAMIVTAVVILAGLAGGAVWLLSGEPEEEAGTTEQTAGPTVYKEIQPALVVNFQGPGRVRYMQVGVVISATDQRALDAVDRHMPVIRNNLIMLLSDKTYEDLNSREGKEQARLEVLDGIRQVLVERTGDASIDSVYFTSFVMQ
jgi:flagellar protein FliL